MRRGFFIVVDGVDGAGKSTLVTAIAQALQASGLTHHVSAEPTHGPYGRRLRAAAEHERLSAREEYELLLHDRQQHVRELIHPALERGEVVLLDRYYYSTCAYQGTAGVDVVEILKRHHEFAPEPDVLLLLDLPVHLALERIQARGVASRFEDAATLERARQMFLSFRDRAYAHVLDASRPFAAVRADAFAAIRSHGLLLT